MLKLTRSDALHGQDPAVYVAPAHVVSVRPDENGSAVELVTHISDNYPWLLVQEKPEEIAHEIDIR